MLLHIPSVLTAPELQTIHATLDSAPWADGKRTAGSQAAQAKNNEQIPHGSEVVKPLQQQVVHALNRSTTFFSGALPKRIHPPQFNRYSGASNHYGKHVDGAVMYAPVTGERVRTDISCTLFLSEPASYEGGELVIDDTFGSQRIKLAAGDMVLYPGTSVHRVEPVTQGQRLACFFWIESMVRSDEQRRLLFDMDMALLAWRKQHGESDSTVALSGTYHNLLRMWADT